MTDIDLNSLSLAELKKLQKSVEKAIFDFEDRKKAEARAALEAQAKEFGFSLAELVAGDSPKKRAPAPAKYCHPENPELTWTGRGRRPQWFQEAIEAGKSPEDLAI